MTTTAPVLDLAAARRARGLPPAKVTALPQPEFRRGDAVWLQVGNRTLPGVVTAVLPPLPGRRGGYSYHVSTAEGRFPVDASRLTTRTPSRPRLKES
jgi:hypothetical protein